MRRCCNYVLAFRRLRALHNRIQVQAPGLPAPTAVRMTRMRSSDNPFSCGEPNSLQLIFRVARQQQRWQREHPSAPMHVDACIDGLKPKACRAGHLLTGRLGLSEGGSGPVCCGRTRLRGAPTLRRPPGWIIWAGGESKGPSPSGGCCCCCCCRARACGGCCAGAAAEGTPCVAGLAKGTSAAAWPAAKAGAAGGGRGAGGSLYSAGSVEPCAELAAHGAVVGFVAAAAVRPRLVASPAAHARHVASRPAAAAPQQRVASVVWYVWVLTNTAEVDRRAEVDR